MEMKLFSAEKCLYCPKQLKICQQLSKEYDIPLHIYKLEKYRDLFNEMKIFSVPTTIIVNGSTHYMFRGLTKKEKLEEYINKCLEEN